MNKGAIKLGAIAGMTVGAAVPLLWGDHDMFGLVSIVGATIGGMVGIYLAVWLSKKIG